MCIHYETILGHAVIDNDYSYNYYNHFYAGKIFLYRQYVQTTQGRRL